MQNAAIIFNVENKPTVLPYQHGSQIPSSERVLFISMMRILELTILKKWPTDAKLCFDTWLGPDKKKKQIKQSQGWAQYLSHHALYSRLTFTRRNETVVAKYVTVSGKGLQEFFFSKYANCPW